MRGSVSFVEIGTGDTASTRSFFESTFGWRYRPMGTEGGWFETPTMRVGLHGGDPQSQVRVYLAVADIEAAIAEVRAAGGHAGEPSAEEPGFGRFCDCRDPQGVRFGLHQPAAT